MDRQWIPENRITDEGLVVIAQHYMQGEQCLGSIVPTQNGCWKTQTGLIEAETDEATAKGWVEDYWKGIKL